MRIARVFGEVSLTGARGRHAWVTGGAFQRESYELARPRLGSTTRTRCPASSLQDEFKVARRG